MLEPRRFRIGKPGLVHGQDGAAGTVVANRQPDAAFMAADIRLAVMPGPADFHRRAVGHRQNLARDPVPSRFRLGHHRGPGAGPREIQVMFAKGDAFRTPPAGKIFRLCDQREDTRRRKADRPLNHQFGLPAIPDICFRTAGRHAGHPFAYHHPMMAGLSRAEK